jgi:hypothetical protein
MTQRSTASDWSLRSHEELIAPVTILDAQGRVVRVLPATEFRRIHAAPTQPVGRDVLHARRPRMTSREGE